jgi:murein DD-endopeptidase MepM/ murein hydrolase activator NlpD
MESLKHRRGRARRNGRPLGEQAPATRPARAQAPARRLALRSLQAAGCLLLAWAALQVRPAMPAFPERPQQRPAAIVAGLTGADALLPGLARIEVVVRRNDTLDGIFRRLELSLADLANLRSLAGARAALDRLMPGEALRLWLHDGMLYALERDLSLTERLRITRDAQGFSASVLAHPVERRVRLAHGVISNSLFQDADDAGLGDATILALAHVFGWDIDFVQGLRRGDEFTVSYEQLWQDGRYVRDGAILAASFSNQGRTLRTVRYVAPDGSAGYYTPAGRSMQKAFLRAPLEFRRVSSRFSNARFHPILNRIRAHEGTDFAAAAGTPVYAAGDGRVRLRGVQGGYGNVVQLEHGGGIVTVYGHLSRFATGLRVGQAVRQGETIAYVGQTGLATGPHLHYEFRLAGRFQDPQRVQLPDASPIDPALRADFEPKAAAALRGLLPRPMLPRAPTLAGPARPQPGTQTGSM